MVDVDLRAADTSPQAVGAPPARRAVPPSTRRILLVILSVFALVGSLGGFYFTADAFDDRTPVLVAAVDIPEGEFVSTADLTSAQALLGDIPHVPWTPEAADVFEGLVATRPIAAGTPVLEEMFTLRETAPIGEELEIFVALDTGLSPTEVLQGDTVLLIDPGVPPAIGDPGRPRMAFRSLELTEFDGSRVRLFVPPEEWLAWRSLPEELGASPLALPVSLGGDPEELARQLNDGWYEEWSAEIVPDPPLPAPPPEPGPGEMEVRLELDVALAPSGIAQGETVLLVDPGRLPAGDDPGRPRSVLQPLELELFDGREVRLFVSPEGWAAWRTLRGDLGAPPLAVPIPGGTDVEDMTRRLDAAWRSEWELASADVVIPQAGRFLATLPLTPIATSGPLRNGDLVLIIDPGGPAAPGAPARPPRVMESRVLEGWDGRATRFWVEPERWAYYTFLTDRLGAVPLVMRLNGQLEPFELDEVIREVDAAFFTWYPAS